jgi:hypothetical protein
VRMANGPSDPEAGLGAGAVDTSPQAVSDRAAIIEKRVPQMVLRRGELCRINRLQSCVGSRFIFSPAHWAIKLERSVLRNPLLNGWEAP